MRRTLLAHRLSGYFVVDFIPLMLTVGRIERTTDMKVRECYQAEQALHVQQSYIN